jgi:hypothetical protein
MQFRLPMHRGSLAFRAWSEEWAHPPGVVIAAFSEI